MREEMRRSSKPVRRVLPPVTKMFCREGFENGGEEEGVSRASKRVQGGTRWQGGKREIETHRGQPPPLLLVEPLQHSLDDLSQSRLIQSSHLRLPQHLRHPNPLNIDVQLTRVRRVVLRIVSIERVFRTHTADVGVQELVLAEGLTLGGVVEGEGFVVLEKASFDSLERLDLFFFVFRVVAGALCM